MRIIQALLLLSSLVLPATMNAQFLNWAKESANVKGLHEKNGDFNNDEFPDLLIYGGPTTSILTNSKGTFSGTNSHILNMQLDDVALLDFNRDGNMDVAACSHNTLVVLFGNGDGSLRVGLQTIIQCNWVTTADLNRDKNPDIVVGIVGETLENINEVIVILGDGHGGIGVQTGDLDVNFVSNQGAPCSIDGHAVAADFNGDKIPDLFITADCSNGAGNLSGVIVGIGDGAGNFAFQKDVETKLDRKMSLQVTEGNNDGRNDVIAVGQESAPDGIHSSDLMLFVNQPDGSFLAKPVIAESTASKIVVAGTFADFDGDGIKDGLAAMQTVDESGNKKYILEFYIGSIDGTYRFARRSPLATPVTDMVWADYNKDAVADVTFVRPASADTWINVTTTAATCTGLTTDRSLGFCADTTGNGGYHFLGNPLDKRPINAMQLYVDGVVQFLTPDDLLDTNFNLSVGKHRITAKAWDDLGAFSNTINLTVPVSCANNKVRTVHLCAPADGATFTSTGGTAVVQFIATGASNLTYNANQIYVDGKVVFFDFTNTVDTKEFLSVGPHRITVKGWDTAGSFSSTANITVK